MNRLAPLAAVLVLAGCSGGRADAPAAAPVAPEVQPPLDLLGTWTSRDESGFVAIGARRIVVAVDGAPRSVSPLAENAIEPGLGAGKLGLADGTALFLARGSSLVGGVPVEHIDLEIVSADGRTARCRLLSAAGLALAARLAPPAAPAPVPPPAAAPPGPDALFVAAVPPARRAAAEALVARAAGGASRAALAAAFADRQRSTFAAVAVLIEQARGLPPAQAAERLREADRRRGDAEGFSAAWRTWIAGRG